MSIMDDKTKLAPIELLIEEIFHYLRRYGDGIGHHSHLATMIRATSLLVDTQEFLQSEEKALGRIIALLFDRMMSSSCFSRLDPLSSEFYLTLQRHISKLLEEPELKKYFRYRKTLSQETCNIPTMLTEETMNYYCWLGQQLNGIGEIVELGAWMGSATSCICEGLSHNKAFHQNGHKLHAYDSFVWEAWMDRFIPGHRDDVYWPHSGDDFIQLYKTFTNNYHELIYAHRCRLDVYSTVEDNKTLWNEQKPIELLIYDMGPQTGLLEALWEAFSVFFISNETIVVFNEYGKLGSLAIWQFCESHADNLVPIHKPSASTKSFLYI